MAPIANNVRTRAFPPTPDDEIVISGISGRFPNSKNMNEYEHNLFNKIDMVDDLETRWRHVNLEIPRRMGKVHNLEKFDATFFGVHFKQAHTMDPQCRMLIEHAFEAVVDAGINPKSLRGTRTGVFVGACFSESEKTWFYEKISTGGFGITGCSRAMLANRVSYTLGLVGPSFLLDTACSSSLYALDVAFSAIRSGECEAALVGASNLLLHPYVTLQFARLGVLAPDGMCRPFSNGATGYTRAEAISVILLQKRKDARRNYGSIIYSKTNCDGFKDEGITYPSGNMQSKLLQEFYADIDIPPSSINYLEAHSTGTIVGDPEECGAIDSVFCVGRDKPLHVGSVKSNVGHSESSAGLCSIAKVILSSERGSIPPNINILSLRDGIKSLEEGRLKVVTEVTKLEGPLIGINGFGFGGANAHTLFKSNMKDKINGGQPTDTLPRLVNWSGRTEEAIEEILDTVRTSPMDSEYISLLHQVQSDVIPGNVFRGYGVYVPQPDMPPIQSHREIQHYPGVKRPVVWLFSGMGSQWTEMGSSLMNLPMFNESIQKSHNVLLKKGIDLINILTNPDKTVYDNILHSFVGIAACQIAIVDILRYLEMEPDYIIGHSVGELGCGYADGCFTAEQMILASWSRGLVSLETKQIHGAMAAVGLGYQQIRNMLPSTIEVACHNSNESSTISGPYEEITKFVEQLKSKGIFAKEVPCSNIAYHSRYIASMGPRLLQLIDDIIDVPKKRSSKWISTSVPQSRWDQTQSIYCSAEYHTNNLLNPVLFEEGSALLPKNAIVIEIAPHALLQAIIKKSLPNAVNIGLTQRGNKNNLQFFLAGLGKAYMSGIEFPISKLYPGVEYPVSRGTKKISPHVKWDHSEDWFVTRFEKRGGQSCERKIKISFSDQEYEFITGHAIDGRVLFPATAYLFMVWETYALIKGLWYFDIICEFEDVKFLRATQISKDTEVELTVVIQIGSGRFEIVEGTTAVVTGIIRDLEHHEIIPIPEPPASDMPWMTNKDFYKELRLRGYQYNGIFRQVEGARGDGLYGKVMFDINWVAFLDCLLQIQIIGMDSRSLMLPTRIQKMIINPKLHQAIGAAQNLEKPIYEVKISKELNILQAGGIEVRGMFASSVGRRKPPGIPVLESYQFIPNMPTAKLCVNDAVRVITQLTLENYPTIKVKAVEVDVECNPPIIQHFQEALGDLPLITADLMLLTPQEIELTNIHVEDGKLQTQQNCMLIVASKCLTRLDFVEKVINSLAENAFLVSREEASLDINSVKVPSGFKLLLSLPTEEETLVLLSRCKTINYANERTIVKISDKDTNYEWMNTVRDAIKKDGQVLCYTENEPLNGIMGLVNCLRKEPEGNLISLMFIDDKTAPAFDIENPFYKNQIKLNLAINVYRNGKWGSYRHLLLTMKLKEEAYKEHCFCSLMQRGDLSTLTWLQGALNIKKIKKDKHLTRIMYSSLNFRDVMIATGKLPVEALELGRLQQDCTLGFEFSGITHNNERVMGMSVYGSMSSYIVHDIGFSWKCPNNWTLEQAATVPVVYITVYMAFFLVGNISKGKSILIHAGSGGIGIAAIRVALAYGLDVFTTVSTETKKKFLLETFPLLKEEQIGNSRDTSFEKMVLLQTKGKGVNYVLNSLADDKLIASIRCLGLGGQFLEIGKFDLSNDTKIGLGFFLKELSFHSVLADQLMKRHDSRVETIHKLIETDIKRGIIQPLPTTVFKANEIEQAFRYLASGKHIGKVLVKMRETESDELIYPVTVVPRALIHENVSFIIPGGLGGFGLELSDWLILRGARNIVLSSRHGITKGYQAYRIKLWQSYGANIIVSTADITTREGCEELIKTAIKLAPVGGIFNLAVKLNDAILENQTKEMFDESLAPKAVATKYLDELSRKLCPELKYFVVFSSVSCGRGNAGQSNYGMANSVMERVIERRHKDGLPAKAIQWGAVGEVGLVADMAEDKIDMEIGGTLQQRISSCLFELDPLLTSSDPIVSSMVVAEKRVGGRGGGNIIEAVMNIMAIRDIKSISMETTLSELGMDSLMAVEIKQTLEREFEVFLTPQDLRSLTFMKLQELAAKDKDNQDNLKLKLASSDEPVGMQIMLRNLGDELNSNETMLRLKSKDDRSVYESCAIFIPGIEGVAGNAWHQIANQLNFPAFILQTKNTHALTELTDVANAIVDDIIRTLKRTAFFYLIGYSFGALLTIELARILEKKGMSGKIILIDGAPVFLQKLASGQIQSSFSDDAIQTILVIAILRNQFPDESMEELYARIGHCTNFDERINKLAELSKERKLYSEEYVRIMLTACFNRTKMTLNYDVKNVEPIKTSITLIRPTEVSVVDIEEDYEMSRFTDGPVTLKFVEGNHITMLENDKLSQIINELNPENESDQTFKSYLVQGRR